MIILGCADEIPPEPFCGLSVSLAPVSIDGLKDFHEYSILPEFYEHLEYPPFETIEQSRTYLKSLIHKSKLPGAQYWFIVLPDSGKVVGTIGLQNLDVSRASVELGYGVSPAYWGRGIFKEAASIVIRYAFQQRFIHRIVAKTSAHNMASLKGLERLGFKAEGVMRDFYRSFTGEWIDAVLLSKLSEGK